MESGGTPNLMRAVNTRAVLAALRAEGQATKQKLAQRTGLSTVTVNAALEHLAAQGVVTRDAVVPSNGGRPAQSYRFNPSHRCGLALYLREDRLCVRVADLNGTCLLREEEPLGPVDGARFRPTVERMLGRYPTLGGIGFGVPGVVRGGQVVVCDHPGLNGVPLRERYEAWYGLPTGVENDVNLAVAGYGAAADPVVYLYFPQHEPPGAGVLLEGALCRGANSMAGEIGNLLPSVDWRALDRGDFDGVCAAMAVAVRAYACILDPAQIVLYGDFLTEAHLARVEQLCAVGLDVPPTLTRSADFGGDYERGTVALSLAQMERERNL